MGKEGNDDVKNAKELQADTTFPTSKLKQYDANNPPPKDGWANELQFYEIGNFSEYMGDKSWFLYWPKNCLYSDRALAAMFNMDRSLTQSSDHAPADINRAGNMLSNRRNRGLPAITEKGAIIRFTDAQIGKGYDLIGDDVYRIADLPGGYMTEDLFSLDSKNLKSIRIARCLPCFDVDPDNTESIDKYLKRIQPKDPEAKAEALKRKATNTKAQASNQERKKTKKSPISSSPGAPPIRAGKLSFGTSPKARTKGPQTKAGPVGRQVGGVEARASGSGGMTSMQEPGEDIPESRPRTHNVNMQPSAAYTVPNTESQPPANPLSSLRMRREPGSGSLRGNTNNDPYAQRRESPKSRQPSE